MTIDQLSFDSLHEEEDTYTIEWRNYRALHPEVYADIFRRALHKLQFEHAKWIGVKGLFEDVRETGLQRDREAVVALNSNWTAPCARDLIGDFPQFEGIIRTRKRHHVA